MSPIHSVNNTNNMYWCLFASSKPAGNLKVNSFHQLQLRNNNWRIKTFLAKWNTSKIGLNKFLTKNLFFKSDRNTVFNIPEKQGVPAPWVISYLLYHSSHALRSKESWIISIWVHHSALRLKFISHGRGILLK